MECCIDSSSNVVGRRTAGGEVRHHLRRYLARIGRYAVFRHAVIARENENLDAVEARHASSLPTREPHNDLFEPAQAARRFRELVVRLRPPLCGITVWRAQ